jgi:hypothetical protein
MSPSPGYLPTGEISRNAWSDEVSGSRHFALSPLPSHPPAVWTRYEMGVIRHRLPADFGAALMGVGIDLEGGVGDLVFVLEDASSLVEDGVGIESVPRLAPTRLTR